MNPYATVALLGIMAIVQSSVLARLDASGVHPDLTLLSVISWSFLRGSREGIVWGFVGGLAVDLLSGVPLGLNALLMTIAGFLAGIGEEKVFRSNLVLPVLVIGAITIGYNLAQFFMLRLFGQPVPMTEAVLRIALPTLVLNLLASPFIYRALRWLNHHTGFEQIRW